nr:amidohydrolase family protein [Kineosporia mesophila]
MHLWEADRPGRRWPAGGGEPHAGPPPTADDLLRRMDEAGVHAAVLVPPSWEGDRNDLALEAARRHPDRFAVTGRIPLGDPRAWHRLATWREEPGLLGVRLTLHRPPWSTWLEENRLEGFWDAAEQAGVPVALYAPQAHDTIVRVAREHPALRLTIDHLGLPLGTVGEQALRLLPRLRELARLPNVAVKASAVPCHAGEPPPYRSWRRPLLDLVDAFGSDRVFWGSDLTRLPGEYRYCVDLFRRDLDYLDPADRTRVLGAGLRSWLGWAGVPSPARSSA